ncbi:MAG: dipeptidase, partial [Gemmatimonadaceae bacterium]
MSAFARRCLLAPALPLAAVLCLTPSLSAQSGPKPRDEAAVLAAAKAIHAKVLSIDTHVDIAPSNFTATGPNYTQRLPRTQVDLVKMEEGGLVGAFLIVYVGQDTALNAAGYARANAQAIEKFEAIHRLTETLAPSRAEIAYTAADARRIHQSGKRVIFIGIENGFPIGSDLSNVQKFYERGGRYLSLAHNGHSQLSDSNTGERDGVWLHNGLSPLGRQVIAEMNRLGMMIDVSHPSKQSMLQTVQLSKAPIIASHSGVRAICGHSRNMDDEQLDALKKNGGVIQL